MLYLSAVRARPILQVSLAVAVAAPLLAIPAAPAAAQVSPRVTLKARQERIVYGNEARLYGAISPSAPGQRVDIVDARGRVRARTRTDEEGRYRVRITPRRNVTLRARWLAAVSRPLNLGVRPRLGLSLRRVRLFGRGVVRGRLRPAHEGGRIRVRIFRNGELFAKRRPRLHEQGRFRTRFRVRRPGLYRASALFNHGDHAPAIRRTLRKQPPLPWLGAGSRGVFVRLLERRLSALRYHLRGVDGSFDHRTADAVVAFNKIRRRPRVRSVDAGTWYALAAARRPRPRIGGSGFHIEVDQTRQVLMTVRDGRVRGVIHVSTGAGGATHDGTWTVYGKIAGYSPHRLYYPSYFDGARAIHGWPSVPTYPASHGCVRVPYWTAKWIHYLAPIGTRVHIYH